jgi:hypothetical protein
VSTNTSIVTEALKAMQSGAGRGTGGASCKGELPEGTVVVCISVCLVNYALHKYSYFINLGSYDVLHLFPLPSVRFLCCTFPFYHSTVLLNCSHSSTPFPTLNLSIFSCHFSVTKLLPCCISPTPLSPSFCPLHSSRFPLHSLLAFLSPRITPSPHIPFSYPSVMVLYDIDAICNSFASVIQSFSDPKFTPSLDTSNIHSSSGTDFVHCFAVKSCPLSYILHRAVQAGLGLECASIMEVRGVQCV